MVGHVLVFIGLPGAKSYPTSSSFHSTPNDDCQHGSAYIFAKHSI